MGEGRGGEGGGPSRVGSGRVGPGRRSTGRSARHARQWRAENGSGKVVAESRLVRPALPHSVQFPTVEKFSGVSTTPPPLHVSPDAKDKNKKYSRGDNAVRFPDVYKK